MDFAYYNHYIKYISYFLGPIKMYNQYLNNLNKILCIEYSNIKVYDICNINSNKI